MLVCLFVCVCVCDVCVCVCDVCVCVCDVCVCVCGLYYQPSFIIIIILKTNHLTKRSFRIKMFTQITNPMWHTNIPISQPAPQSLPVD